MSRREHLVLRVGALVVLALSAWLPRGTGASPAPADVGASASVTSATLASVSFSSRQAQAD